MVSLATVQSRGQVTLPKETRDALSIQPGARIVFRPTGPHTAELEVLPEFDLEAFWERFSVDVPYDDAAVREAWQADVGDEIVESR